MDYKNEEWRDVKFTNTDGKEYDYEGLYQVSNLGRIKSLGNDKTRKERILKQSYNTSGYLYVRLSKDGKVKNFTVHRLVAIMFIPNHENLPIINHKNEDKSCNVWTNLEWCTQKYNVQYSAKPCSEETKQRMSEAQKRYPRGKKIICLETNQVFDTVKQASEWCHGSVGHCCQGSAKTAGGYHWQYLDDYRREQRMNTDINNSRLAA